LGDEEDISGPRGWRKLHMAERHILHLQQELLGDKFQAGEKQERRKHGFGDET